jgi:hypothetical protein
VPSAFPSLPGTSGRVNAATPCGHTGIVGDTREHIQMIRCGNLQLVAGHDPTLADVLESAARLQEVVPDAVLVGGSAAAWHAGHRDSFDHDHVLPDLADRFDLVLDAIEATEGWVTNRLVPGKLILGELGDIEAGVRQMIRRRPLEVEELVLASGKALRVPTVEETLRVKGFLVVRRNQTRDFLDVAALATHMGIARAARVLASIDAYYQDQRGEGDGVATQLARQLADPSPRDSRTTKELDRYKRLDARWHDWRAVADACRAVADAMLEAEGRP